MDKSTSFLTQDSLLHNFRNCLNWEEKYLYIIELGCLLPPVPKEILSQKHLVPGCQSKVWIIVSTKNTDITIQKTKRIVKFHGNSDSPITKGILCIIFIAYQGLTIHETIYFDPYPFLNKLKLTNHLTHSRSQGILSILQVIQHQAKKLQT